MLAEKVDNFSRYFEIEIPKDIMNEQIIYTYEGMPYRQGIPYQVTSDIGP